MSPMQDGQSSTARKIPMRGWFLESDELHQVEKPYAFKFPADAGNLSPTNMKYKRHDESTVIDMRGFEKSFTINKNGFTVLDIDCDLKYEDFNSEEGLSRYFRTVESLLKDHLGASRVQYFRHGVSIRLSPLNF